MIITCDNCRTRFQLEDRRIPERGARVRCSRCQHRFEVKPPTPALDPDEIAERAVEDTAEDPSPQADRPGESGHEAASTSAPEPASPSSGVRAAGRPVREEDPDLENPEFLFDRPSASEARLEDHDAEPPSMALLDGDAASAVEPALGLELGGVLGALDDEEMLSGDDWSVETTSPRLQSGAEDEGLDLIPDAASRARSAAAAADAPLEASEREAPQSAAAAPGPESALGLEAGSDPFAAPASDSDPAPSDLVGAEAAPTDVAAELDRDESPPDWSDLADAFDPPAAEVRAASEALDSDPGGEWESAQSGRITPIAEPAHALEGQPGRSNGIELGLRLAAAVLAVALLAGGALALERFALSPPTGPDLVWRGGWAAELSDQFHRHASDGERVLVVRGRLLGQGGDWLPGVRAQLLDGAGQPIGSPVWADHARLAGPLLSPESIDSVLANNRAPAYPAPARSDNPFTLVIPHPAGVSARYRLELVDSGSR